VRQPLVAPLGVLAAGVAAGQFIPLSFAETLLSGSLLAVSAWAGLRLARPGSGMAAMLVGFALAGACVASLSRPEDPDRVDHVLSDADFDDPIRLRGWVSEPSVNLDDADQFVVELKSVLRDTPASGGIRVTANRSPGDPPLKLAYGRRVEFLARARRLRNYENPGSFDRVRYLHRREIYLTATVRPRVPILDHGSGAGSPIAGFAWSVRELVRERLDRLVAETNRQGSRGAAVLRAMLLGERSALTDQTQSEFQRTGVYHVLVVSGLHVGVIAWALFSVLRLTGVPRALCWIPAALAAASYAALVGSTTPALRAAAMLALYTGAALLYRRRSALNVTAAAALFFVVADPEALFDASFQLSFLAVGLIAAVGVPILEVTTGRWRRALPGLSDRDRDLHMPIEVVERRLVLRDVVEALQTLSPAPREATGFAAINAARLALGAVDVFLISVVLLVGMALPLIAYFQRISFGSPFANIIAAPLIAIVVPLGLLSLATSSTWLFGAAAGIAELLASVVSRLASGWALELRVPPPPLAAGLFAAAGIVAWGLCAERSGRRLWGAVAALAGFVVLVVHPFAPRFEPGRLELAVLDVGQGESLLLTLPDGRRALIDAGGLPYYGHIGGGIDIGERVVSPYLWSRSIRELWALALTHPDADHIGGARAVLENFKVGELWLGGEGFGLDYAPLEELARRRGVRIRRLHAGDRVAAAGVELAVLSPSFGAFNGRNDDSLALLAHFGTKTLLLTGDLESKGERALLDRLSSSKGGLLKVAHHGSRTSTAPELLDRFQPSMAAVSAGFSNPYGHPHPEVLERLRRKNAMLFSTYRDGLLVFSTDGQRLRVDTARLRRMTSGNASRDAARD